MQRVFQALKARSHDPHPLPACPIRTRPGCSTTPPAAGCSASGTPPRMRRILRIGAGRWPFRTLSSPRPFSLARPFRLAHLLVRTLRGTEGLFQKRPQQPISVFRPPARLAADVTGVPTLLVARTDADAADLITSDCDPYDSEFITGEARAAKACLICRNLFYSLPAYYFMSVLCYKNLNFPLC